MQTPLVIDAGTPYKSALAGGGHSCGLTTAGRLKCWGDISGGKGGHSSEYLWPMAPRDMMAKVSDSNTLVLTAPTVTTSIPSGFPRFSISLSKYGDANLNGTVTAYYCNATAALNCDPLVGSSFSLGLTGSVYSGGTGDLTGPSFNTGDRVKILIQATDTDGVAGEYLREVTLP